MNTDTAPVHTAIAIVDRSSVGEARRNVTRLGERARLSSVDLGRVQLIATELATNQLHHAHDGEVLVALTAEGAVEVLAVDRGPGITNVQRCMADGYSTSGSRGCGLGAVQRQSDEFDIYSTVPNGTAIRSRVGPHSPAAFSLGTVSIAAPGEVECGDACAIMIDDSVLLVALVDGLGHGPLAATAAKFAVEVFQRGFDSPARFLRDSDEALRSSRGAAIGAMRLDPGAGRLKYAGIGNIAATIVKESGKTQSLLSHNGIVGAQPRKFQELDYNWEPGDLVIVHSDGLSSRWKMSEYPGLARTHPAVIAGVLYRDYKRSTDDTTILVARELPC